MKTLVRIMALFLSIGVCQADVYKCIGEKGVPQYTSEPGEGCVRVEIKNTLSSPEELQREQKERVRHAIEEQKQEQERQAELQRRQELAEKQRKEQALRTQEQPSQSTVTTKTYPTPPSDEFIPQIPPGYPPPPP